MKKVEALDPHLQYPEVGPGEAADGRSLHSGEVSARVNKNPGVLNPGHLLPKT